MAKPSLQKYENMPGFKKLDAKTQASISYRVERISSFAWRPVKVTTSTDGTVKEETAFKDDTLEIVMRKLALIMREDGNIDFNKRKANAV